MSIRGLLENGNPNDFKAAAAVDSGAVAAAVAPCVVCDLRERLTMANQHIQKGNQFPPSGVRVDSAPYASARQWNDTVCNRAVGKIGQ